MKLIVAILAVFCTSLAGLGNPIDQPASVEDRLARFVNAEGASSFNPVRFLKFTQQLEAHQSKSKDKIEFLQTIFDGTHRRFLKHFKATSRFTDLFERGNYNCLTATSLYSVLLTHFGYDHQIIETTYHIFIIADVEGKKVLLETTDELSGFVTDENEITQRINTYRSGSPAVSVTGKTNYVYKSGAYNVVDETQLIGLLHYNLAVEAYNTKDFEKATTECVAALQYSPSLRLEEFSQLLLVTVLQSNLDKDDQVRLVRKIQSAKAGQLLAFK